jgi:hypothetical protein
MTRRLKSKAFASIPAVGFRAIHESLYDVTDVSTRALFASTLTPWNRQPISNGMNFGGYAY